MIASLLIMLREALEAVLVVGILLGYLARSGRGSFRRYIWFGVAAGIAASLAGAVVFELLAGGFEGKAEQLFEGITMFAGALLMTGVIVSFARQSGTRTEIERTVESNITRNGGWGLFLLSAVAVLREGVEAVLFIGAASFQAKGSVLAGAGLGLAAALAIGYLLLVAARRIRLGTLFTVVNVLLVAFASGLMASAVHELTEAGLVHPLIDHVWDMNPAVRADGSFPALHDEGSVGGILQGLFGYRGAPSLAELMAYCAFLAISLTAWAAAARHKTSGRKNRH